MNIEQEWRLRLATTKEQRHWNELIDHNPDGGTFLATDMYAAIKQAAGWTPRYFIYETPYGVIAALALTKYIFPIGELWYFPKGPSIASADDLQYIVAANENFIARHKLPVFLVKIEPPLTRSMSISLSARCSGLIKARPLQANTSTMILPLSLNPEQLLQSLYRRARRYIAIGLREDVTVQEVVPSKANFKKMYELMKTVSGGNGPIALREYAYYERFWRTFAEAGAGRLYFAFENDTPVVGAFVVMQGKMATYKDGGSDPTRKSKAAAYLLQWQIMQDMAALGMEQYDLCGMPPHDRLEDPTHYLHGVGRFKLAFSKEVIEYCGVYDQVCRPICYSLWDKWIGPVLNRLAMRLGKVFW